MHKERASLSLGRICKEECSTPETVLSIAEKAWAKQGNKDTSSGTSRLDCEPADENGKARGSAPGKHNAQSHTVPDRVLDGDRRRETTRELIRIEGWKGWKKDEGRRNEGGDG